ncbi:MAG TPA: hypothetical protein VGD31_14375 [Sphingobacteriaceae bacterium]
MKPLSTAAFGKKIIYPLIGAGSLVTFPVAEKSPKSHGCVFSFNGSAVCGPEATAENNAG